MRRCTRDPDGRVVVFDAGSQLHLALRRPWLLDHLDAIMATISDRTGTKLTLGQPASASTGNIST